MDIITKQAKYIFALPFAVFGLMHFMMADVMAGAIPSFLPGGAIWVYLTGAAHIAASAAIILNKHAKQAAFWLGVMMLVFAFLVHLRFFLAGDEMQLGDMLKAIIIAGAAFFYSDKA